MTEQDSTQQEAAKALTSLAKEPIAQSSPTSTPQTQAPPSPVVSAQSVSEGVSSSSYSPANTAAAAALLQQAFMLQMCGGNPAAMGAAPFSSPFGIPMMNLGGMCIMPFFPQMDPRMLAMQQQQQQQYVQQQMQPSSYPQHPQQQQRQQSGLPQATSMYPPQFNGSAMRMQQQQQQQQGGAIQSISIKRERHSTYDEDAAASCYKRAHVTTFVEANLEECISQYIAEPQRFLQRVQIAHSTVAQRSYGHEKRYLCPPPLIALSGNRWRDEIKAGIIPRLRVSCDGNIYETSLTEDERFGLHAVSKSLYVADHGTSRPSSADVAFEVTLNDECTLGTFRSAAIGIISKPIKKIRSDRPDMCLKAKTPIALFNRVRGQTVSTRYLCVDGRNDNGFGVTGSGWSAFELVPVPTDSSQPVPIEKQLSRKASFICHGQLFQLRDMVTGKSSPPVILHKVDKNMVFSDCDDPVSQLMKVALCVPSAENQYLSLCDGVIALHKAIPHPESPSRAIIMEGAAWTITSTKHLDYSFADMRRAPASSPTPLQEAMPVHSVPTLQAANVIFRNFEQILEIRGDCLDNTLVGFIGTARLPALVVVSEATFHAVIPPQIVTSEAASAEPVDHPIVLARRDGVLFPTSFAYSPSRRAVVPVSR